MRRFGRLWILLAGVLVLWAGASMTAQDNLLQRFQVEIRDDMERLAEEVFGAGIRPDTWTANGNVTTPNFIADLFFDNEQLADAIFGVGERDDNWFGVTSADPELVARNIRHDLELSATTFRSGEGRPFGWVGAPKIYTCSQSLQNLVRILDREYNVRTQVPESVVDYCGVVRIEIEDRLYEEVLSSSVFQTQLTELLGGNRGDLERLADELLGLETRPDGWVANRDATTASFVAELFDDIDRLADNQLGVGVRPTGWIGQEGASPATSYRVSRFDIELLADEALSTRLGEGGRPNGWQGTDPISGCDTTTQSLLELMRVQYGVESVALPARDASAPREDFCKQVVLVVNNIAENPPAPEVVDEVEEDQSYRAKSLLAFSYLDVAALQYMGVMPRDTEFRAWYRNFNESNMMFVSGDDFAVFIDRRFTTMAEEVFRTLPTLEGVKPLTFCDASWCNGPGPTPTPTGVGPIVALLQASTPAPTRDPQALQEQEGKRLVSWNNIRVQYLLDRAETRTVQVTLEICSDPSQIACEPVISVFDGNTNTFKPVIQTFNGLNVYEFPYGYLTNLIVEGQALFSRDLWISDPLIRGG